MEDDNKILHRQLECPEIRKVDRDARYVEFVASDGSIDSYGTVLPVEKWDLGRYERNGVVGYQHDVYGDNFMTKPDPDDVIGKGRAWVEGDQLIIGVEFEPADLNPKADKIYRKIQFGTLNAVSVGFQPNAKGHFGVEKDGENPDVYYYNGQTLLEVSVVNIPANANAIKRSIEEEIKRITDSILKPEKAPEVEKKDPEADAVEVSRKKLLTVARAKAMARKNQ